jgi:hypothetical protein
MSLRFAASGEDSKETKTLASDVFSGVQRLFELWSGKMLPHGGASPTRVHSSTNLYFQRHGREFPQRLHRSRRD